MALTLCPQAVTPGHRPTEACSAPVSSGTGATLAPRDCVRSFIRLMWQAPERETPTRCWPTQWQGSESALKGKK
jgi:hypothetical protein